MASKKPPVGRKGKPGMTMAHGKTAEMTQASAHPPHNKGGKDGGVAAHKGKAIESKGGKMGHGLTMSKKSKKK